MERGTLAEVIINKLEVELNKSEFAGLLANEGTWILKKMIGRSSYKVEIGIGIERNEEIEYLMGIETDGGRGPDPEAGFHPPGHSPEGGGKFC